MVTSLLALAKKTKDSDDSQTANDFMESHADLEQAFEAGQPRCQKVKTEYCKCDCGKHKVIDSLSENINLEVARYILKRGNLNRGEEHITLDRVEGNNGIKWAIRKGILCMDKQGRWEYEPSPSNRDTIFLNNCRWDTAQEAINAFKSHTGADK